MRDWLGTDMTFKRWEALVAFVLASIITKALFEWLP